MPIQLVYQSTYIYPATSYHWDVCTFGRVNEVRFVPIGTLRNIPLDYQTVHPKLQSGTEIKSICLAMFLINLKFANYHMNRMIIENLISSDVICICFLK